MSELFVGAYGVCLQAVEPPHRHRSQAGWEDFAYQGLILRVNRHFLVKLAHVLHRVRFAVIDGERRLVEASWQLSLFDSIREG